MFDPASIQRWIEESQLTCDGDPLKPRSLGKAQKRPYPTPEPESSILPKRRRGACRESVSRPEFSNNVGISHNMTASDGEMTGPDAEATPRAALPGRPSQSAPSAQRPDFGGAPETLASGSPRSSAASSSSMSLVSSGSKRSRRSAPASPSKRAMLRTIPSSIDFRAFRDSDIDKDAPLGFKSLVDQILDFAEGLDTVPAQLKDDLAQYSERSFRRPDIYYASTHPRSRLGRSPTLAEVDRIVDLARELREDGDSEAAYNSLVHGPLFALALSLSHHSAGVAIKNIVHARIAPTSLVPLDAYNESIRSKMVDWAVVLRPVGNLDGALARGRRLPDGGQLSFNHSRYGPLVDKPIVVSIETKPEGENLQQAYVQLAVWASSHLNRLRQLLTDADAPAAETAASHVLPHLPLLIAQGSQWSFLFACRQADGTTHIHAKIEFGDACTRHGVFKIVSVLQLLINWAELEYRPCQASATPFVSTKLDAQSSMARLQGSGQFNDTVVDIILELRASDEVRLVHIDPPTKDELAP
ncbi:hypothetical protein KCU59_g9116, partial [Aureobasidium melanogenum]